MPRARHPLPFAIARLRGRARAWLRPGELRELLARREAVLVAGERAAVQAALDSATPEQRGELERLLALHPGTSSGGSERVAADRSRWA